LRRSRAGRWWAVALATAAALVLLAVVTLWHAAGGLQGPGVAATGTAAALQPVSHVQDTGTVQRGEYLARLGNCMGCHTAAGGAAFAGGRGIETPFGTVYAPNLTPDIGTGLGRWTADDFWGAMHHGKSRDGRLLYPAFPYPSYTYVTRQDADDLFGYLRSLPAVEQANRPHTLRFPFSTPLALAAWRTLYFRPQAWAADAARPPEWNRGAYLVQGLGHCAACHAPRNSWGATVDAAGLRGGMMPVQNWLAPSLAAPEEAGVSDWPIDEIVSLLQTGQTPRATVSGPMAEVVFGSTQYLRAEDARAMAVYLQSLPVQAGRHPQEVPAPHAAVMERGRAVYASRCAQCHGDAGQGRDGHFPALAGNRAVNLHNPANLVRMVLEGGYAPATTGNPWPAGMPPFNQVLGDEDIAAVLSYVRNAWGNRAAALGAIDVYRVRERRAPG